MPVASRLAPLVLLVLGALGVIGASIVVRSATGVYRCALYVFASEGVVPEPYTSEMMNAGWTVKRQ
jgi:hypothetical protein